MNYQFKDNVLHIQFTDKVFKKKKTTTKINVFTNFFLFAIYGNEFLYSKNCITLFNKVRSDIDNIFRQYGKIQKMARTRSDTGLSVFCEAENQQHLIDSLESYVIVTKLTK